MKILLFDSFSYFRFSSLVRRPFSCAYLSFVGVGFFSRNNCASSAVVRMMIVVNKNRRVSLAPTLALAHIIILNSCNSSPATHFHEIFAFVLFQFRAQDATHTKDTSELCGWEEQRAMYYFNEATVALHWIYRFSKSSCSPFARIAAAQRQTTKTIHTLMRGEDDTKRTNKRQK